MDCREISIRTTLDEGNMTTSAIITSVGQFWTFHKEPEPLVSTLKNKLELSHVWFYTQIEPEIWFWVWFFPNKKKI
jgi:hypothetical protein